jgi:hypothetical protein
VYVLLDAALQAATGAQLLRFRGACATAQSAAEREAATACLLNAETELTKAARAVSGLLKLAKVSACGGSQRRSRPRTAQRPTAGTAGQPLFEPSAAASGPRPTVARHDQITSRRNSA